MGDNGRTVAIIQARMGSSRLPGKVLRNIAGQPMLWHVVRRVCEARTIDTVVVATSILPGDDAVADFCANRGIACFRGSESDVLDRYYQAARMFDASVIVRITADCPFVDPHVLERGIREFQLSGCEYLSNALRITYPDGLDMEVFTAECLAATWRDAQLPAEREHVTPYMRTSGKFGLKNMVCEIPLNRPPCELRFTVDEPRDLEFANAVFSRFSAGTVDFGLRDILDLIEREPYLMSINRGIICNEGYYKSLACEPGVPPKMRTLQRSKQLKAKALKLIPSCSQTFSKCPTQFVQGVAPVFLQRGKGCRVWDVDDNEYIDYAMSLGPIILGHNYPRVTEAVCRQMQDGTSFSLPHPLEVELAEMLTELIPCAEMVRFAKNGSDATSGAIRAARAYTRKEVVACCGYHGWQDWYIATTTRNRGVPKAVQKLTCVFDYDNISSLEKIFVEHPGQVAAVIMEPVGVAEPRDQFLQAVREVTHREQALLIFDEVVTGFRLAMGGAQEYFGVIPDLACFGKAMANGYPLAAVVGPQEIMKIFDEIFFSFTFGGETLSLAASVATISEMKEKHVISHIWDKGRRLKDGYNVLAGHFGVTQFTQCTGLAPRAVVTFKDEGGRESLLLKSLFQQECLKRGVLFTGGHNICYTHSVADIDQTLRVYRTAMQILAEAIQAGNAAKRLEGPPVELVFRRP